MSKIDSVIPVPAKDVLVVSMFSLFDKKALTFGSPFYYKHKGEALRFVQGILSNVDSAIAKHPADFTVYLLGTMDIISGEVRGNYPPIFVEEVLSLVEKK